MGSSKTESDNLLFEAEKKGFNVIRNSTSGVHSKTRPSIGDAWLRILL